MKRFIEAQERDWQTALSEIRAGRKYSHWIWYIFPQIQGLGQSSMSYHYGIKDLKEAVDYLEDSTLGPRLREITAALLEVKGRSAVEILGNTDAMKVRSCMTLFDIVSPHDIFEKVLIKYYRDTCCMKTVKSIFNQMNINRALSYIGADPKDFHLKNSMFFRSPYDSIHGIDHVYRTMIACALIGEMTMKPREGLLAFCAAYIHDLARATDYEEAEHGENAALNYFDKFGNIWEKYRLTPDERSYVKEAVRQHSIRETLQSGDSGYDVMAILKDADALDRCRIGDLDVKYLRYKESRYLVRRIEYIYQNTWQEHEDISFCEFLNYCC